MHFRYIFKTHLIPIKNVLNIRGGGNCTLSLIALTANRNPKPNLFGRILEEPYSYRYRILTSAGAIKRLIPTKELGIVD